MGVRLIRENSDTPNVINKDDARMVRYAYGGQNGYVQKYGRELDHSVSGNTFTVGSGIAVLQGWEVVVDSAGWQIALSAADATKRYYSIYLEVNLALGGTAEIKSTYESQGYPTISEGDDLTENQNGIARLELYRFTATQGAISDIEKRVAVILYSKETGERPRLTQIINSDPNKVYVVKSSYSADFYSKYDSDVNDPIETTADIKKLCPDTMSVLPLGAGNSIASIVFQDGDWKDYIVFSCVPSAVGNSIQFGVERLLQNIYRAQWNDGTPIQGIITNRSGYRYECTYHQCAVKCTVKDIYGNEFVVAFTVAFGTQVSLGV